MEMVREEDGSRMAQHNEGVREREIEGKSQAKKLN